jgi:hypothetical protein
MNKYFRDKLSITNALMVSRIRYSFLRASQEEDQITTNKSTEAPLTKSSPAISKKILRPFKGITLFFIRPFLHRFRFFMTEIILEEIRVKSYQSTRDINDNFKKTLSHQGAVIVETIENSAYLKDADINDELYAIQHDLISIKLQLEKLNAALLVINK